jgi:bifunctional N-acetylglucosamine-1-phosphate-uridyltransferase/glucosamine-1-phosphate-acetyltransferase GlmU-like protein
MMLDKQGNMRSPQQLLNALQQAKTNQGSIVQELYSPAERLQMARLERALQTVVYRDPNPSGTASGAGAMVRELAESIGNTLGVTGITKLAAGTALRPVINQYNRMQANRAVNQAIPENPPSFGAFGATAGHEMERNR